MERKSGNFSCHPNGRCTNLLSQTGQLDWIKIRNSKPAAPEKSILSCCPPTHLRQSERFMPLHLFWMLLICESYVCYHQSASNRPIIFNKFLQNLKPPWHFPCFDPFMLHTMILPGSPGQPPKAATTAGETRVVPGHDDKRWQIFPCFCGWSRSCRIRESHEFNDLGTARCLTALKDACQQVELCEEWCSDGKRWENYVFVCFWIWMNQSQSIQIHTDPLDHPWSTL